MKILKNISICLVFLIGWISGWSQTCCSAGAPVGSYLEIQHVRDHSISIQLGYEYNSIDRLIDNNRKIENDPRTRYGQSISGKVDYVLNKRWAFSALLPLVHQSRSTFSEQQGSFGLGDLIVLSQYNAIANRDHALNFSVGIKFPIGERNHKSEAGIFLSPDMQSGSGSFDYLFRFSFVKNNLLLPYLSPYVNTTYRVNGTNKNFGSTDNFDGRQFAFGDELIGQFGFRYLITTKIGFFNPDIGLKLRWTGANEEQFVQAPNSGGMWVNLPIGISFTNDQTKSIAIRAELPLFQQLNGLQITTNYLIGFQLTYIIPRKNNLIK